MGNKNNPKLVINNFYNTTYNYTVNINGTDVGNPLVRYSLIGWQCATSLTNAVIAPSFSFVKDTAVWGAKETYARLPSLKK